MIASYVSIALFALAPSMPENAFTFPNSAACENSTAFLSSYVLNNKKHIIWIRLKKYNKKKVATISNINLAMIQLQHANHKYFSIRKWFRLQLCAFTSHWPPHTALKNPLIVFQHNLPQQKLIFYISGKNYKSI